MLGFLALGLLCGHHLQQVTPHKGASNAAMMVLIIGPSGHNKTSAWHCLESLIQDGPSRFDEDTGEGIHTFRTPNSPEALADEFRFLDPSTGKMGPVTGLLREEEFASTASKSKRQGMESMKPRFIDLFDFVKHRDEPEVSLRDRARTTGPVTVYDSYFSAIFTTQTDTVRDQISDQDTVSGFMNRILPVFGEPRLVDDPTFVKDRDRPPYQDAWDELWDWIRTKPLRTEMHWASDVGQRLKRHPYLVRWA